MVYTADQVGRPERRRKAVAVEPMTCPPDAFRTGTDLVELDPGESWQGSWGLRSARDLRPLRVLTTSGAAGMAGERRAQVHQDLRRPECGGDGKPGDRQRRRAA